MQKTISLIIASALVLTQLPFTVSAAENKPQPKCSYFVKSDVNGCVTVNTPEGASAEVNITFASPEGKALPYYSEKIAADSSLSFDIEGHDNTDDDYRNYTISVVLSTEDADSEPFTDTFTIPDGNDNPDSFTNIIYNFLADDEITDEPWKKTPGDDGSVNVLMHISGVIMGDVDGDGKVSASDATAVLLEYSALSTGESGSFSKKQFKAGDVNKDGAINSSDASSILAYYAALSTNQDPHW